MCGGEGGADAGFDVGEGIARASSGPAIQSPNLDSLITGANAPNNSNISINRTGSQSFNPDAPDASSAGNLLRTGALAAASAIFPPIGIISALSTGSKLVQNIAAGDGPFPGGVASEVGDPNVDVTSLPDTAPTQPTGASTASASRAAAVAAASEANASGDELRKRISNVQFILGIPNPSFGSRRNTLA